MNVAIPSVKPRDPSPVAPRPKIASSGRLRGGGLTDTERNFALAMHLTPLGMFLFAPFVLTPLVLWLVKKDESPFVDDHGREVLNLLLSALVFTVGLGLIPILGWTVLAIWYIVTAVNLVRGAIASSHGEYFRYPMTIRFLS